MQNPTTNDLETSRKQRMNEDPRSLQVARKVWIASLSAWAAWFALSFTATIFVGAYAFFTGYSIGNGPVWMTLPIESLKWALVAPIAYAAITLLAALLIIVYAIAEYAVNWSLDSTTPAN